MRPRPHSALLLFPLLAGVAWSAGCGEEAPIEDGGRGGAGGTSGTTVGPTGAGANTVCGDGVVERPEPSCDTCARISCGTERVACRADATCQGFLDCMLACSGDCVSTCAEQNAGAVTTDLVACLESDCDDACSAYREACEGEDLAFADCTDFGFANPAGLTCSNCTLDASGCQAECGNGIVEAGESCDAPNSTFCDACQAIAGTCAEPHTISLGLGRQSFTGSTVGAATVTAPSDDGYYGCDTSRARVHAITTQSSGVLTAALDPTASSDAARLYVLDSCGASTALGCTPGGTSALSWRAEANTTYYLHVGVRPDEAPGAYALTLDLSAGTCADPGWMPRRQGTGGVVLGDTSNGSDAITAPCAAGTGAPEMVYQIDNPDDGAFNTYDDAFDFDAVTWLTTNCGLGNEVCTNGSPPFIPGGSDGSYLGIDGNNAGDAGTYRFRYD